MTTPNGRRRRRALPGEPTEASATVEQVQRILGETQRPPIAATRIPKARFLRTEVSPAMRSLAALLGVFLAYAVLRIQELYPVLDVPRLPLVMALTLAVAVIAATPLDGWRIIWESVPPVRWQVLLVMLGFCTAPIGIWMSGSLRFYLFTYSISVIVFLVTVVVLRDRRAMATTMRLVLLAIGALALYTISDAAITMGRSGRVRLGVTLDPNDLAMLLVALTPMALWMAHRRGGRSIGWTAVAVLTALAIVPTQSRGAIIGMGAVAVTLIVLGTSGWKRAVYVLGTVGVAVGIFLFASATGADRLTDFTDYSGGESRSLIWKRGLVWMSWRPWGYGIDNFPIFFGWLNGPERAAHNSFIQVGVELGLLGLLAFTMLFVHTGRELLRQRRHALSLRGRAPLADQEAALATYVLTMMVGTAATGFFLSKAYSGITLFAQGLGIAVLLGYPYWAERARQDSDSGTEGQSDPRRAAPARGRVPPPPLRDSRRLRAR